MSGKLRLNGATSGYSELQAPDVAGDQTFTLPAVGGTLSTVGYQQGVWIPTLSNGTATSSNLVWSRSGNTVTIQGQLQDFSDITTNSPLSVAGLPYSIDNYQAYGFCASNRAYTTTSDNPINMSYISPTNEMRFYGGSKDTTVGGTTLDSSGLTASSVLHFSISYLTDDTTWTPANGATLS